MQEEDKIKKKEDDVTDHLPRWARIISRVEKEAKQNYSATTTAAM